MQLDILNRERSVKKVAFFVIVLLFVAAASLAATSFWLGIQAQQQYQDILERTSRLGYVHLANEGYDRGFLRSKARTAVKLRNFDGAMHADAHKKPEEQVEFTLVHDIRHGPLPLGDSFDGEIQLKPVLAIIETRVELSPEMQDNLKESLDELPEIALVKSHTVISLTGDGEMRFIIPAFHRDLGKENKVNVNWKGLIGNMAFTADFKKFTGSLKAPGLEALGDDRQLEMSGWATTFDTHEGIEGLFLGDASFLLAQLKFIEKKAGEERRFSMIGLQVETSSHASTDTINYAMTVRIDRVLTDDMQYGPGVCKVELRKFDAASLARLQQAVQDLQAQLPQRSAEGINQMIFANYAEILPGLMKKSPEIEIAELSLKTSDGDFRGQAKIVFDGTNTAAMINPLFLLSAVTAHAEFSVADRLLQRIQEPAQREEIIAAVEQGKIEPLSDEEIRALTASKGRERLQDLVNQNILLYEDGHYKASADYQQGRIILNGRQLGLQDLLQQG